MSVAVGMIATQLGSIPLPVGFNLLFAQSFAAGDGDGRRLLKRATIGCRLWTGRKV